MAPVCLKEFANNICRLLSKLKKAKTGKDQIMLLADTKKKPITYQNPSFESIQKGLGHSSRHRKHQSQDL